MLRCLFPALAVFAMSDLPAQTPPAAAPQAPPCADAAHRQFDFWVGNWDVTGPKGKKPSAAAGSNRGWAIASSTNTGSAAAAPSARELQHLQRRDRAVGTVLGRQRRQPPAPRRRPRRRAHGAGRPARQARCRQRHRRPRTHRMDAERRRQRAPVVGIVQGRGQDLDGVVRWPVPQGHDAGSLSLARNERRGFRRALRASR